MKNDNKKDIWNVLSAINVNKHVERKQNLTYLSWAWAWGVLKEHFPAATYTVREWDNKPYLFDANLGYLVETSLTIDGITMSMRLPVMDGANKAMKAAPYTYGKYNKVVEPATMFDINTAIMRCLVKNMALFGLGFYIYAGEDLPQVEIEAIKAKTALFNETMAKLQAAKSTDELKAIHNELPEDMQNDKAYRQALKARYKQLESEVQNA